MSNDALLWWVSVYAHNTPQKDRLVYTMILETHNETVLTYLTSWDTQVKNVMPYCFEEKKMTEPGAIPKEADMRKMCGVVQ